MEESASETARQLESLLDVKYVLLLLLIFMTLDVYYAAVFGEPLCRMGLKELYESFPLGSLILFICLFPIFYMLAIKARHFLCDLTYGLVLRIPGIRRLRKDSDAAFREYSVNEYSLLEYALLSNDQTLYQEFKDHEASHMRFVHVCDLTFALGLGLALAVLPSQSSVSVCFADLGIPRFLLLLPAAAILAASTHAPRFCEHEVFVGKKLAERIRKSVDSE